MGNHPRTAINQILMEEKTEIYHEPAALEAAEQAFYELLGEDHSLSPPCDMTSYADQNNESRDECHPSRSSDYNTTSRIGCGVAICVSTNPCMFLLSPILCHCMPHQMEVPHDAPERILIAREVFGKQAMNVIACEGSDRMRDQTYRQWQVRNLRAGFTQL
ncbi:hypothetical protein C1H46_029242 [Malus baccata]|uniref:Uncharacterized protein n=1 Tax=Malus baccata TaxID=106549 RepID=A0A540LFC0_MALBA|nr:hypothetical protein C1H46_029242 [Malus baccata]